MRHRKLVIILSVLAAAILAGCGPGGEPRAEDGQPADGAAEGTIRVTETEWDINLPEQIAAGSVTFSVHNRGTIEHNFVIPQRNVRIDGIQPGQTKTLTVDLPPGTYQIVCDIPGHSEAGMTTQVITQ